MKGEIGTIDVRVDVALEPAVAFDVFVNELRLALDRDRITFDARAGGRLVEGGVEVGRVIACEPGRRIQLEWHPQSWSPETKTSVEIAVEAIDEGTRVVVAQRGWDRVVSDRDQDLLGWFAGAIARSLLTASAPVAVGDWLTDRRARRPQGAAARAIYRDPLYHRPLFKVILRALDLHPTDYLVEIGCGGGAMLADALASGCRAAAIDHSADMLHVAGERNRAAIAQHRLMLARATADRLPFVTDAFTCAAMIGVFGFLADPVAALGEIRRVLRPGGRLIALGSDPSMRGTPAAPEPMASRLHFYTDDELSGIGRRAGFDDARVERHPLAQLAREAGVPEAHLALFEGPGAPFLFATKRVV